MRDSIGVAVTIVAGLLVLNSLGCVSVKKYKADIEAYRKLGKTEAGLKCLDEQIDWWKANMELEQRNAMLEQQKADLEMRLQKNTQKYAQ